MNQQLTSLQNATEHGIIPGVTDKNYITNSYHVHVTEEIDAFSKLAFESEFRTLQAERSATLKYPNMQDNIPAVLSVMKFIYDNIMYAELNTKSITVNVVDTTRDSDQRR